ncbi:cobalamin biosynthesis protein [Methanolobus bombayensis]|uniref:cobalamin biosynthesis protein n=1 Tax=Methanolobus bombayensis TaxID=38023 RepID=UPI001AE6AE7A|nr:cobalamin biosynthesis protein [Methanolobus bombayensis]MBP1910015.1 adenosylcobinamide-phosphate synthase [Methanolobus bombayensis]
MMLPVPVEANASELVIVLILAYALDLVFCEPPFAIHPVVWMGRLIGFFKKHVPENNRRLYGIFMGLVTILFGCLIAYIVMLFMGVESIPSPVRYLVAAYFLKATFAIRCLYGAADEVRVELDAGKLDSARQKLSMYVSRDTSKLEEGKVSSAIIETTSENYVDGILSPLLFYACFGPYGLMAAYIFKATSTLDSMVGYMDERHREIGWFSAKLDDVFNWIPARLSVIFLATATLVIGLFYRKVKIPDYRTAFKTSIRDGLKTPSPNSGFPMASIAGALNIKLEKPSTYVLGDGFVYPMSEDIKLTSWIILVASFFAIIVSSVIIVA